MEKNGVVTAADNKNATVTVMRDSACGENCAACGLCGNMREMTVNIKNTIGLREGDRVRLSSSDSAVMKRSALGYASLTALLICGGAAGNVAGGDLCAFFGAVLGVAVGVLLLKINEKHRDKIEIKVEKI